MATSIHEIGTAWTLVHDAALSGPLIGTVEPSAGAILAASISSSAPGASDPGFLIDGAKRFSLSQVDGDRLYVRAYGSAGHAVLSTNTVPDAFPLGLITSSSEGFGRLRVDVAQTSFFEGREFRTFREWTMATTGAFVIKAVVPLDVILWQLTIQTDEGAVRLLTKVGGTEGGTFSETLPILSTNTMSTKPSPAYAPQVVLTAGGTHTGGTTIDVLRAKTAGNTNFASSVGESVNSERGVGAATYYFDMTLTGFIGTFSARWEERP